MASKTAGSASLDTNSTDLFDESTSSQGVGGCTSFSVTNPSASTVNILVNIPGLHASAEWFPIAPGQVVVFRNGHMGIRKVSAKAASDTATVLFGIVSKTSRWGSN